MKNKNKTMRRKTYRKKLTKREVQKKMWIWLLGVAILCGAGIRTHGIMVGTEIVLAQDYDQVTTLEDEAVKEMTIKEHVWRLLTEEGDIPVDEAAIAIGFISDCENRAWNPYAIGVNKDGTLDFGIFQINEYWAMKSDRESGRNRWENTAEFRACMFDVYCNTREAIRIYKDWGNWGAWSCYE